MADAIAWPPRPAWCRSPDRRSASRPRPAHAGAGSELHDGQIAIEHVVFDPSVQKPVFFALTPARVNDITVAKHVMPIKTVPPMCSTSATTISPGGPRCSMPAAALSLGSSPTPCCVTPSRAMSSPMAAYCPTRSVICQSGWPPARNPFHQPGRRDHHPHRHRQDPAAVHQRSGQSRRGNRCPLQGALADRAVLQVDQAEPQHHPLHGMRRECHPQPDRRRLHAAYLLLRLAPRRAAGAMPAQGCPRPRQGAPLRATPDHHPDRSARTSTRLDPLAPQRCLPLCN